MMTSEEKGQEYRVLRHKQFHQAISWFENESVLEKDLPLYNMIEVLERLSDNDDNHYCSEAIEYLLGESTKKVGLDRMSCRNFGIQEAICALWEVFRIDRE